MGNDVMKGSKSQKSETVSTALRQKGNDSMSLKNYPVSLETYTSSIAYAPPSSVSLGYAYANRAATLKAMGHFIDAIEDCERALQCGYPDHLKYKVERRLGQCYFQLNVHQLAKINFEAALSSLNKAKRSEIETVKPLLMKELDECNNEKNTKPKKRSQPDIPRLRYGPGEELVNASKGVDLKFTKDLGRHLVASEDFLPGEILMVEKPIAAVLYPEFQLDHCTHCFKACRNPIPCRKCTWALFCSEDCLKQSNKSYHSQECKIVESADINDENVTSLIAIRMLCTYGFDKMKQFLITHKEKQITDPEEYRTLGFNSSGQYDPRDPVVSYYLQEMKSDPKMTWEFEKKANIIARKIIPHKSPIQIILAKLLTKFQKSFKINKSVVLQFSNSVDREFTRVGKGVYGTYSLINHSCYPNVTAVFYGNTLVLRAIRSIPKGTQLCVSYGVHFLSCPKIERHRILKNNHGYFKCKCEACGNNWPLEENLPPGTWFNVSEDQNHIDPLFSSFCVMNELAPSTNDDEPWKITNDNFPHFLRHIMIVDKFKRTLCGAYHRLVCDVRLFLFEKAQVYNTHLL